jgi:hypothetical protein
MIVVRSKSCKMIVDHLLLSSSEVIDIPLSSSRGAEPRALKINTFLHLAFNFLQSRSEWIAKIVPSDFAKTEARWKCAETARPNNINEVHILIIDWLKYARLITVRREMRLEI